ncbi:NUDIX hydrolase [Corynebacterium xerosis]|uniref:NUDIX domain-containing protein n=1 Tax=Corynebacterium xerosis TaxID=1725 RepID=A0A7X9XTN3_9CORY|nr:NUDIX domain-containing protein [Corynebacterium xerosis]NMF09947.1 NUDIX domain-containing protein [Corynebacterium xerosis]
MTDAHEDHAGKTAAETWTMYDADRIPTGATMRRGDDFRPGELHLVVHVCIFDAAGRMLIQRRTDDKVGWPGMWDVTVGGSVTAGESSASGAEREVLEELGIRLDLTGRRPNFTFNFRHGFDDFYLLKAGDVPPIELADLAIPNAEVADARWATRDEIHALHAAGEFIPYRPTAIDFIFDMVGRADILDLADQGGRPGTDAADFG